MSLLEDLQEWYKTEKYPPDGPELDQEYVDGNWVDKYTTTVLVSEEDNGNARWGTHFTNVYQRGDEFIAVSDVRPATEMQDWGDYGDPEIYEVTPRTEVVTKTYYDKV